jgi:hypothetical protein
MNCLIWQDVRGGAANWAFAHENGRIRQRQQGTFYLFHKEIHKVNFFVKKIWSLPPCRRRIGPCVQADACFGTDRVRPVI